MGLEEQNNNNKKKKLKKKKFPNEICILKNSYINYISHMHIDAYIYSMPRPKQPHFTVSIPIRFKTRDFYHPSQLHLFLVLYDLYSFYI